MNSKFHIIKQTIEYKNYIFVRIEIIENMMILKDIMWFDLPELFITSFIITSMKTIRMEEINVSHGEKSTQS